MWHTLLNWMRKSWIKSCPLKNIWGDWYNFKGRQLCLTCFFFHPSERGLSTVKGKNLHPWDFVSNFFPLRVDFFQYGFYVHGRKQEVTNVVALGKMTEHSQSVACPLMITTTWENINAVWLQSSLGAFGDRTVRMYISTDKRSSRNVYKFYCFSTKKKNKKKLMLRVLIRSASSSNITYVFVKK